MSNGIGIRATRRRGRPSWAGGWGEPALPPEDHFASELMYEQETSRRRTGEPAYVRWLQRSLNRTIAAGLAVDGVPGPQTERALMAAGAESPPTPGPAPSPSPSPMPAPSAAVRACPAPAGTTTDRCVRPMACQAIPGLLCVTAIGPIPFEYPTRIAVDPASRLRVVADRRRGVTQRFVAPVATALARFSTLMGGVGLPFEAILTLGSYYCRCMYVNGRPSDRLSNHSAGQAIDVAGVRWSPPGPTGARVRETIVHNFADAGERAFLRRINACLRLAFPTVIDYHRSDHRDHFHCDLGPRNPRGGSTVPFVKECLNLVQGAGLPINTTFDAATRRALAAFAGVDPARFGDAATLNAVLDRLFARVASGR